jgi:alkylhydroperoxidase/carboxymuconolactone decarboxylase family protein YurZ
MEPKEPKKPEIMYPEFQYLSEKHPELYQHFMALAKYPLEKGKCLDLKTKLFIPMVILAFRGQSHGVYTHIKRALGLGVTEEEIVEAFLVSILPGGAPTMVVGLRALLEVKKEMENKK